MKRLAALTAGAALAVTPVANAHELTASQERTLKHRWQLSSYKRDWYRNTRQGRWSLRPGFKRCDQIKWPRPRGRCFKHRQNLRFHTNRMTRLGRILWPPRQPLYNSHAATSPQAAICGVFGPYCQQALAVAQCESGFSTSATNGQYVGLFQMGSSERATYGDAADAYGQAQAAYRYFAASGYSWGPWSCRP